MALGGPPGVKQLDRLFETLAKHERRRMLYYLREHGTATKRELVDVLTGWAATDREGEATTGDDWIRIQTTLHHVHLPRLVDEGLVEYDPATDVIRVADLSPWVERCLDAAFESDGDVATPREQPANYPSDESS